MTDELILPDDATQSLALMRMPMEWRTARTVDVRFPDRVVELVAVPYNEETQVMKNGRWIVESVAPGSFDGVERRANRVKVNRDHDLAQTIGRCAALHPSRTEGLVAQLRISRTPLGDETLELCADGALDASVGFAPFPGHEHYTENRTRRLITKAFLGHIALTPDPAYEGAQVLAVRSWSGAVQEQHLPVPTPNLDRILAERMQRAYDARQ